MSTQIIKVQFRDKLAVPKHFIGMPGRIVTHRTLTNRVTVTRYNE